MTTRAKQKIKIRHTHGISFAKKRLMPIIGQLRYAIRLETRGSRVFTPLFFAHHTCKMITAIIRKVQYKNIV